MAPEFNRHVDHLQDSIPLLNGVIRLTESVAQDYFFLNGKFLVYASEKLSSSSFFFLLKFFMLPAESLLPSEPDCEVFVGHPVLFFLTCKWEERDVACGVEHAPMVTSNSSNCGSSVFSSVVNWWIGLSQRSVVRGACDLLFAPWLAVSWRNWAAGPPSGHHPCRLRRQVRVLVTRCQRIQPLYSLTMLTSDSEF